MNESSQEETIDSDNASTCFNGEYIESTDVDRCSSVESDNKDSKESDYMYLDIARTNSSQKKCVICKAKRYKSKKLKRIPKKAIIEAYLKTSILIQFGCRACVHHFDEFEFLKSRCLGNC